MAKKRKRRKVKLATWLHRHRKIKWLIVGVTILAVGATFESFTKAATEAALMAAVEPILLAIASLFE